MYMLAKDGRVEHYIYTHTCNCSLRVLEWITIYTHTYMHTEGVGVEHYHTHVRAH